jgi:integrase
MEGYRRGQKHVRNLRLYEVKKNGRSYWRLRTPDPSGTGFSERQSSSEPEALTAFEVAYVAHQNHGVKAGSLSARQRGEALSALDILEPFAGVSLVEAAKFYYTHHLGVLTGTTVAEAIAELLKAKKQDGLSPRYHRDLRNRLERFILSFGTRKIAEVSVSEIDSWLRDLSLGSLSRNTFWLRLHVLFEFARRRRWCVSNPCAEIGKAKWIGAEPGILSPEQFGALLANASALTLPYWAIGGFCGLRSAELERLEWSDIDFERGLVEVTPAKSKTASRRHVVMRPALLAWLRLYRGLSKEGKVCPPNLRKLLLTDRDRAGISDWPPNALRHSFASYALEHFQEPGALTIEMGHSDPELVARYYRRRVRPAAARAWWEIMPSRPDDNIVQGQFRQSA